MILSAVLAHLCPQAEWAIIDNSYDSIVCLSDGVQMPTRAECEKAWKAIEHEHNLRPIRAERNRLLAASDWTQVADAPVDGRAWAAYRQALRDLPATVKDSGQPVDWPTPPE